MIRTPTISFWSVGRIDERSFGRILSGKVAPNELLQNTDIISGVWIKCIHRAFWMRGLCRPNSFAGILPPMTELKPFAQLSRAPRASCNSGNERTIHGCPIFDDGFRPIVGLTSLMGRNIPSANPKRDPILHSSTAARYSPSELRFSPRLKSISSLALMRFPSILGSPYGLSWQRWESICPPRWNGIEKRSRVKDPS